MGDVIVKVTRQPVIVNVNAFRGINRIYTDGSFGGDGTVNNPLSLNVDIRTPAVVLFTGTGVDTYVLPELVRKTVLFVFIDTQHIDDDSYVHTSSSGMLSFGSVISSSAKGKVLYV